MKMNGNRTWFYRGVWLAGFVGLSTSVLAQPQQSQLLAIPPSLQAEHHEIHEALSALTQTPGAVGTAAKALAETLHEHFVKEEEMAMPLLGLLKPLSRGEKVAQASQALAMADKLKAELPQMLREHEAISAAAARLKAAGEKAKNPAAVRFSEALLLHAATEEDVLYPAALLVGERLRRSGI
jgi:iron-sulfur cluster repair protein YtfE (RIC family)